MLVFTHRGLARLIVVVFFVGALIGSAATAKATTVPQARQAIRRTGWYTGQRLTDCHHAGRNVTCQADGQVCYQDSAFGPSLIVGTTVVGVGPRRRVWIITPDTFNVYPGLC